MIYEPPMRDELGRWNDTLAKITPHTPHTTHLYVAWEPGDPWQPINRWVIWNLLPVAVTLPAVLKECHGPHPRSVGYYDTDKGHWVDGPCRLIDRRTWEVFRETGRFGRRWWAIQGTNGGHRYRLTPPERVVWRTTTGLADTPALGDLPYAPFDNRVLRHLLGYERVMGWMGVVQYGLKNKSRLDSEEQQEIDLAKQALAGWLMNQMDETWDEYGHFLRRVVQDIPAPALAPVNEEAVLKDWSLAS